MITFQRLWQLEPFCFRRRCSFNDIHSQNRLKRLLDSKIVRFQGSSLCTEQPKVLLHWGKCQNSLISCFLCYFHILCEYLVVSIPDPTVIPHPLHSPPHPSLATWRQLHVGLLHSCPHRVWVSATQQYLIWIRENEKSVKQLGLL